MVLLNDLAKLADESAPTPSKKPTLMAKYNIPVQHLEFDYVAKCCNGRELEKILQILRSGEEGYFPDLTAATENRLREVKPNSKLLRVSTPVLYHREVDQNEWHNLSGELREFVEDIQKKDYELTEQRVKADEVIADGQIRQSAPSKESTSTSKQKRIAATDYSSWDKYDPDTEILKMDLQDEKLREEAVQKQKEQKKETKAKAVRFNNFATEAEAIFEATREKEKGNECYKAGELTNALQHYTNSLECKPLVAVYTNRALIYHKLKRYEKAVNDCKQALKIEPRNFKAYLRLTQSYEALGENELALKYAEKAIEIDPNQTVAQETASKLQKILGKINNKTRFTIEDFCNEVKDNTNNFHKENGNSTKGNCKTCTKTKNVPLKSILKTELETGDQLTKKTISQVDIKTKRKGYEVISIPGPSTMLPPYYKVVYSDDPEIVKKEKQKILLRPHILHITNIDMESESDEQEVLEIPQKTYKKSEKKKSWQTKTDNNKLPRSKSLESAITAIKSIIIGKAIKDLAANSKSAENSEPIAECTINKTKKSEAFNTAFTMNLTSKTVVSISDKQAGGEPYIQKSSILTVPSTEELQSPFTFIQMWNSATKDNAYNDYAEIIKKLDLTNIHNIIGCKMDDVMLSTFLHCLQRHFTVPDQLDTLHSALLNLVRIPRYQTISMFLGESDIRCIDQLLQFLDQHGRHLPDHIAQIYKNNI